MNSSNENAVRIDYGSSSPGGRVSAIWPLLVTTLSCTVLAVCGWVPFARFGNFIRIAMVPGNCSAFQLRSPAMYLCSAKVAALTLVGPVGLAVLLLAVLFAFRKLVTQELATLARKLPYRFRSIVAPLIATLFFTVVWAGSHYGMALRFGLLPQILFPVVTGLFAWTVMRYDPILRRAGAFGSFLAWRDKVPLILRTAVMLMVSALLSLSVTFQNRVSYAAFKEQIVVVVTLVIGYVLLSKKPAVGRSQATKTAAFEC